MRPTDLGFRSPKEKTPASYLPQTTIDGRPRSVTPARKKATIPQSKRFVQYEENSRKTGYRVGPGLYNLDILDIARGRITGTPLYRENHGNKDYATNGYYYVGNHVVFDPYLVSKFSTQADRSVLVDISQAISDRPKAIMGTSKKERKETEENKPWFMRTYTSPVLKTKVLRQHEKSGQLKKSPYKTTPIKSRPDKQKEYI